MAIPARKGADKTRLTDRLAFPPLCPGAALAMTTALFIIDPQQDFCDGPANGALAVPGAWADMDRLAGYIQANAQRFEAIIVTLDSHSIYHIAHPAFWVDADGTPPPAFTSIGLDAVESGRWRPVDDAQGDWVLHYLFTLERSGRCAHTIWPPHCLVGTPGHLVHPPLMEALNAWQVRRKRPVTWVIKGQNTRAEQYSALRTEVSDPLDPPLGGNSLADILFAHDRIEIAGEALSHCVRHTVEDLLAAFRARGMARPEAHLTLLTNMTSSIPALPGGPDFPALSQAFLKDLEQKGATLKQG